MATSNGVPARRRARGTLDAADANVDLWQPQSFLAARHELPHDLSQNVAGVVQLIEKATEP